MRISDWSSDVCSSDLNLVVRRAHEADRRIADLGVIRDIDQVACRGEFASTGEAIAVNLRSERLGEIPHPETAFHDMAAPITDAGSGVVRNRPVPAALDRSLGGVVAARKRTRLNSSP